MKDDTTRAKTYAGMAAFCGLATGFAGWLFAILAALDRGNWTGAGTALIASALAFGLFANAVFRH